MFELYKKSKWKAIWIFLVVFFAANFILLLYSTFEDQRIADYASLAMYKTCIKYWYTFANKVGLLVSVYAGVIILTVFIESVLMQIRKSESVHPFVTFMKKANPYIAWIWYGGLMVFATVYISVFHIQKYSVLSHEYDLPSLLKTSKAKFYSELISGLFLYGFVIACALIFRLWLSKDERLLTNRFWKQGIKLTIFFFCASMTILVLKYISGRPHYFLTILTKDPKYGSGKSIQELLGDDAKLFDFTTGQWQQADYMPWYIPNHFLENMKYWGGNRYLNENGYGYWSQDFPSGHASSTFILSSMVGWMFYDGRTKKLTWWEKTLIVLAILMDLSMMAIMVMCRFHWMSDVVFSGCTSILWWWAAEEIVRHKWLLWMYFYRSKKEREQKNRATYKISMDEKNRQVISYMIADRGTNYVVLKKLITEKRDLTYRSERFKKRFYVSNLLETK